MVKSIFSKILKAEFSAFQRRL